MFVVMMAMLMAVAIFILAVLGQIAQILQLTHSAAAAFTLVLVFMFVLMMMFVSATAGAAALFFFVHRIYSFDA